MLKIACCGKSDVGMKRTNNEDAFLVKAELGLTGLADGMGGAAAGELASRFFTDTAEEIFSSGLTEINQDILIPIGQCFDLANRRILGHVEEMPEHRGMGCTAELLVLNGQSYYLGHVGDSRTYLFRRRELTQLTHDHSFVQDLMDKGVITRAEARTHRMRHVIMRAVGTNDSLTVELKKGTVEPGDLFLLCSDGLTDMVEDMVIEEILSRPADLPVKAMRLIEAAKAAGGFDNVTVVMTQVFPGP